MKLNPFKEKVDIKDVKKIFEIYKNKNCFIPQRKLLFFGFLSQVANNIGLKFAVKVIPFLDRKSAEAMALLAEMKVEFGNLVLEVGKDLKIKGKIDKENFSKLVASIAYVNKAIYKLISEELKENKWSAFEIYLALLEAMNNFELLPEHMRILSDYDISVENGTLTIKKGRDMFQIKLIKVNSDNVMKKIYSLNDEELEKIFKQERPGFKLGLPFILYTDESNIKKNGNWKKIIEDIKKFLIKYFTEYMKFHTYCVKVSPLEREFLDMILIKSLQDCVEASIILDSNRESKSNEFFIGEDLKEWLIDKLEQLKRHSSDKKVSELADGIIKKIKNAKLVIFESS